jgi:hypothetical protein
LFYCRFDRPHQGGFTGEECHGAEGAANAPRLHTLLRGLAGRVTGQADEPSFAPALAEIEEALVPALIVEKLEDGSYTVLVPSVPTPMAGAIYILPPERVHPVDVPFTVALKVFSKWGTGAGGFVRAMQAAKPSQAASSAA